MSDIFFPPADPPGRSTNSADEQARCVRALCRQHAAALVVIAGLLIDDADTASDIVAATLAAACRDLPRASLTDREMRAHLARSVYHRCLGRMAARERFPQLSRATRRGTRTAALFDHLSLDQRALLALTVFGGHDIAQTAQTLRMPMFVILDQLPHVLPSIDVAARAAVETPRPVGSRTR